MMGIGLKKILLFVILCCLFIIIPAEGQEMKAQNEIALPEPKTKGVMSLEESIAKRRSVRSYRSKKLSLQQISQLLWAAQGVTDTNRGLRAAPSAGGMYPLEIYLVKDDGIFNYKYDRHSLEKISGKDVRSNLVVVAWNQIFIQQAPVSVVICAVRSRVTDRYGARGDMYVDIEVGHAAENLHLQAVALGLASVPVGAFDDGKVRKILGLPRNVEPIYIIPVGYAR